MPVLVRWERVGGSVTLRAAEVVEAGSLLPDHVLINGVVGMEDDQHPDLEPVSVIVPRAEIGYVAVCKVVQKPKVDDEKEELDVKTSEAVQSEKNEVEVKDGERSVTGGSRIRRTRSVRRSND
jgi:hypothetical protein